MSSRIYRLLGLIYYSDRTYEFLKNLIYKLIDLYSKIKYRKKRKYLFPWSDYGKKSLVGTPLFPYKKYAYYTQYYSESLLPSKITIENSDLFKYEIFNSQMLKSYTDINLNFSEESLLPISIVDNNRIHEGIFFDKSYIDIKNNKKKTRLNNLVHNRYNILKFNKGDQCTIKSPRDLIIGRPISTKNVDKENDKKLVLVLFFDALGSKLFERYPLEEVMPNTYNFFSKGIIFKNCYSNAEFTIPSLASMTTGKYVHNNNFFHPRKKQIIGQKSKSINSYFRKEGYFTQLITGNYGQNPSHGYCIDYDRVIYKHSMKMHDQIMEFIDSMRILNSRDTFTWMSLLDIHHPLGQTPSFSATSDMELIDHDYKLDDPPATKTTFRSYCPKATNRHLAEMKKVDYHLKHLYKFLEENYTEDDFLVTLVSDHATSATIDTVNKASILCKEKTNVPFMIRGSGFKENYSLELIENVDILPSILSSCNIEFDKENIDGGLPKELGGSRKDYIFTESIYPGQTYKASIKDGKFECFLEGKNLTNDSGEIDIAEFYFSVNDINNGAIIEDRGLVNHFLREFEKVLKVKVDINRMLH